jgi:hypothetical protein
MTAPERTTVISHEDVKWGIRREYRNNEGTRVGARPGALHGDPVAAFNAHHAEFARVLARYKTPGLAMFVVGPNGRRGYSWSATTDELRTVSLGRHSFCNFALDENTCMSLRQVLVLVGRQSDPWRARVVDLSTQWGFSDDRGGLHRHVAIDRLAVLGLPGYWLFFFETGTPLPWSVKAASPWDTLVARSYQAASGAERVRVHRPMPEEVSRVTSYGAPISFSSRELVRDGEEPLGALVVRGADGVARLPLGAAALERGVLVGRDPRCGTLGFRMPSTVSRVHALVMAIDGDVFIADTGSTNGLWEGDRRVRLAGMETGRVFELGKDAVAVQWSPAN